MTHEPSTPIDECLKDCTPEERADLKDGKLPHVRTWGDLETVRGLRLGTVVVLPSDATVDDVAAARKNIKDT